MKKLFFVGLAIVLFTACDQKNTRYTQQSPEIDRYKKSIEDYENQNWEALAAHYADTAKIMNNVPESEGLSPAEMIQVNKEDASIFKSWDFVDEHSEYEMVKTDDGETWVNFWSVWEGTLKTNGKKYTIPAHITAQFKDGKIVKEFGYWDTSKLLLDLQALNTDALQDSEDAAMVN